MSVSGQSLMLPPPAKVYTIHFVSVSDQSLMLPPPVKVYTIYFVSVGDQSLILPPPVKVYTIHFVSVSDKYLSLPPPETPFPSSILMITTFHMPIFLCKHYTMVEVRCEKYLHFVFYDMLCIKQKPTVFVSKLVISFLLTCPLQKLAIHQWWPIYTDHTTILTFEAKSIKSTLLLPLSNLSLN